MIQNSLKVSEGYPTLSSSASDQYPLTYQGKYNRLHTPELTANKFDADNNMESQDEELWTNTSASQHATSPLPYQSNTYQKL